MAFPYRNPKPTTNDEEKQEAAVPSGSGTAVAGYVESPTEKKCGTCEYLDNGTLCNQETMQQDDDVPTDPKSGLKIVHPDNGCCSFWEENKSNSGDMTHASQQ